MDTATQAQILDETDSISHSTNIYIYIYIYIIRVLVVTKSLCGYVSNQVKYNMESTQYLG